MADIQESLTNKLGPFPAWVWGAIVVAGAWGYHLYRHRSSVTPVAVAPVVTDSTVMPSTIGNAPGTNTWDGSTRTPQGVQVSTNPSWAKVAADALISLGGDPTTVENALGNYLNGQTLNPAQQSIVDQAIRTYGTPPNGILPIQTSKDASAFTGHTYTVQQGDTLQSILAKFYNDAPGSIGSAVAAKDIAIGNGLQWNAASKTYDVAPGTTLKLYQDSLLGVQDSTFHWTGA